MSKTNLKADQDIKIDELSSALRGAFEMTTGKLLDSVEEDRSLLQRVKVCLNNRGYAPLRSLEISVERGVVLAQGQVPTFYMRQIAIECIKRVTCVTQVVDRIEVVDAPDQCQPSVDEDAEQDPSQPSLRRRMDLRYVSHSAGDAFHTHVLNRDLIREAYGGSDTSK